MNPFVKEISDGTPWVKALYSQTNRWTSPNNRSHTGMKFLLIMSNVGWVSTPLPPGFFWAFLIAFAESAIVFPYPRPAINAGENASEVKKSACAPSINRTPTSGTEVFHLPYRGAGNGRLAAVAGRRRARNFLRPVPRLNQDNAVLVITHDVA